MLCDCPVCFSGTINSPMKSAFIRCFRDCVEVLKMDWILTQSVLQYLRMPAFAIQAVYLIQVVSKPLKILTVQL